MLALFGLNGIVCTSHHCFEFFWLAQDVSLECLLHGNLYRNEALEIVDGITGGLNFKSNSMALRTISGQVQRVSKVEGAFTFSAQAPNPQDLNSAIYQYYQAGPGSFFEDVQSNSCP